MTDTPAGDRVRIRFTAVALTAVHLAGLGLLGSIVLSFAFTLLVAGVSTFWALGIGFAFLFALVYLLFGVGWFEQERAAALYGFPVAGLRFRAEPQSGFAGWLRAVARQSVDGGMWRAVVSFAIGSMFGLVVLRLALVAVWSVFATFSPNLSTGLPLTEVGAHIELSRPATALALVLALGAILGLSLLHAVIARALLGSPTRSALAAEARTQQAQRVGAVRAADVERTRIERDLHDGVQPRLVSVGMTLGLAQQKIDSDPAAAKQLVAEAHTSTKAAITELRQLARGIHASVLDDRGLDAALSALAARSYIPVHLDVRLDGRPPVGDGSFRDAEAAVYFCIAESLTNAAKHSRAGSSRVLVRLRDPGTAHAVLWARIEDDGVGGAQVQSGGGLDGIANRVLAAGGRFRLDSPHGGPTTVEVSVPCAS